MSGSLQGPPPDKRALGAGPLSDRGVGLLLAAAFLALYVATLCPGLYWYDSAEYVAAALTLGIPHPPGYPLYVPLAHVFTWLPLPAPYAVNLMSAVAAAGAVATGYHLVRELGAGVAGAALGAGLLGVSPTLWDNATVAEVYAPALWMELFVWWLLLRARRTQRPQLAHAAAALAGLGLGLHLSIASTGLGLLLLCSLSAPGSPRDSAVSPRALHVMRCGAWALGGAAIFLSLLPRALLRPAVNQLEPPTFARFLWLVSGGNYKDWFVRGYDLPERILRVTGEAAADITWPGLALAGVGLWLLFRRDRLLGLSLLLAVAGNVGFFFEYDVHDLMVFLLPSTALCCLLVGLGAEGLATALLKPQPVLRRWLTVLLLGWPLWRAAASFEAHDRGGESAAAAYGQRLVRSLPRGAVILTYTTPAEWKYDAVFALYHQRALGQRSDVVVARQLGLGHVERLLREGRAVFLSAPVDVVADRFRLVPQGDLWRVEPRS